MNEKILKHYKLIYLAISRMNCNKKEQDTYFYYGLMGLYNGIRTYDSTKGVKESTYYYKCIKNEITNYFRYITKNKRNIKKYEISINTPLSDTHTIEDTLVSDIDIESDFIKQEEIKLLYKALNKCKNTRYKTFIMEHYGINQEPKKIREIASKYGMSSHAISSSIKQGLKYLKRKIEKEYEKKSK